MTPPMADGQHMIGRTLLARYKFLEHQKYLGMPLAGYLNPSSVTGVSQNSGDQDDRPKVISVSFGGDEIRLTGYGSSAEQEEPPFQNSTDRNEGSTGRSGHITSFPDSRTVINIPEAHTQITGGNSEATGQQMHAMTARETALFLAVEEKRLEPLIDPEDHSIRLQGDLLQQCCDFYEYLEEFYCDSGAAFFEQTDSLVPGGNGSIILSLADSFLSFLDSLNDLTLEQEYACGQVSDFIWRQRGSLLIYFRPTPDIGGWSGDIIPGTVAIANRKTAGRLDGISDSVDEYIYHLAETNGFLIVRVCPPQGGTDTLYGFHMIDGDVLAMSPDELHHIAVADEEILGSVGSRKGDFFIPAAGRAEYKAAELRII